MNGFYLFLLTLCSAFSFSCFAQPEDEDTRDMSLSPVIFRSSVFPRQQQLNTPPVTPTSEIISLHQVVSPIPTYQSQHTRRLSSSLRRLPGGMICFVPREFDTLELKNEQHRCCYKLRSYRRHRFSPYVVKAREDH